MLLFIQKEEKIMLSSINQYSISSYKTNNNRTSNIDFQQLTLAKNLKPGDIFVAVRKEGMRGKGLNLIPDLFLGKVDNSEITERLAASLLNSYAQFSLPIEELDKFYIFDTLKDSLQTLIKKNRNIIE